ncbi:MAG: helix-turn-helix domain-containing protein [Phycisphaerae bacterium]
MFVAPPVPPIDPYVLDCLLPDLVGHDRRPAAFIVYLAIWRRSPSPPGEPVRISLQSLAGATGLSRSAVQDALAWLRRRGLIATQRTSSTSIPAHTIQRPWLRSTRAKPH